MPIVDGKEYAYTAEGMAAAERAKKKSTFTLKSGNSPLFKVMGSSPARKLGDYEVTLEDINSAKAGGATAATIKKLQDSKSKSDQKKENLKAGKERLSVTVDPKERKNLEEGIEEVEES